MAQSNVKAITLSSIDSATFSGSFQLVAILSNACSIVRIINSSGVDVIISYDGTNNNDVVQKNSTEQLSFQANNKPNGNVANMATGTKIYVKAAASTGLLYVAGYYSPVGG